MKTNTTDSAEPVNRSIAVAKKEFKNPSLQYKSRVE